MKHIKLFEDFDSKAIKIKDLLEDIVALDYILSEEGIMAKYYITEKMASGQPNRYMIGTSDDISSKIDESWNEATVYKFQVYFDSNTFSQKEIADEYYSQLKEHLESVYDARVVKDKPYTKQNILKKKNALVYENCVSVIVERQPDDYVYFDDDDINESWKRRQRMRYLNTLEEIAIMADSATTAARSYLSECEWDLEGTLGNCAFFAKDFYEWCDKEGIECGLAYLRQDESFSSDEIEDHIVPVVAGKIIDFVYTDQGVSRRARTSNMEEALRRQTNPEITDLSDFEEKYSKWGYSSIEDISYEEAYSGPSARCRTIDYPERIEEAIKIPIEIGEQ